MMIMKKKLVFDMDGTIADLYNVNGWLECLRSFNAYPYAVAKPMVDMLKLRSILVSLKEKGWEIAVTTWLSMDSNDEYDSLVTTVKEAWLIEQDFPYDEFHAVPYGTPKHEVTKADIQILIDDNNEVRSQWIEELNQPVINANNDILESLELLLL